MHLNIRSLHKNFDDLHEFVSLLPFKPDMICLSESRINQPLKNIQLQGYHFFYAKPSKKAGGVAVYVNTKLKFTQLESFQLFGTESIWLKIVTNNSSKSFIIGSIYPHPTEDVVKFIDEFSECLEKLGNEKKTFYILGDMNININKTNQNYPQADRYMQAITSNGAFSLITKPTRVTDKTATVIDHIITNDSAHSILPRVVLSAITDHYPIMCKISKIDTFCTKSPIPLYRNKKNFCSEAFSNDLDKELGNLISSKFPLNTDNFDEIFDLFVNLIAKITDKHAPLERMSRKQRKLASKPWITNGILISIRKKNAMFRTHFVKGNLTEKTFFRHYSKTLTRIKALSKKIHFHSEFERNKKNSRKTWEIIRSVLPSKPSRDPPAMLKINELVTQDPNVIANQFNDFFCSIGPKLADNINYATGKQSKDFLKKKVADSIYLVPPTNNEVLNLITSLKNKAVGHDNIQPFFLKTARFVIAPYLNLFLNFVFTEGIFPTNCKIARVVPIHKSGAQDDMNNYRPISILTCFSKIIEKILYARLYNFFKKHSVIYENQYGFQSNISTIHAMLDVVTSCYDGINDSCYTALSFVDLRKAFDTVSHQTLLVKLSNYGVRGVAYNLIHSYLYNRQQFVSINQRRPDLKLVHCGVPQGSSLGPLFFLIYINDLNYALVSPPRLFADDTCLIVKDSNCEQ